MRKLFVLGNGFDIASGLPTKYTQFREWFINNYFLDYEELDRIVSEEAFGELIIPQGTISHQGEIVYDEIELANFFYAVISHANENDVTWKGFEENLVKLPFFSFEASCIWDEEDEEEEDFHKAYAIEDEGINLADVFVEAVNYFFSRWIRYIYMEKRPKGKLKIIEDNTLSTFLTFNYTSVLEDYYGILPDNVCHIHGYVRAGEELIVGHGAQINESDDFEPFNINSYTVDAQIRLKKDVCGIIQRKRGFFNSLGLLDEVYVIGLNMENSDFVDAPYLREVFRHTDVNTIVYINKFDLDKVEQYKETCRKNGFGGRFGVTDSERGTVWLITG